MNAQFSKRRSVNMINFNSEHVPARLNPLNQRKQKQDEDDGAEDTDTDSDSEDPFDYEEEASKLISSEEEAELEAQRISFHELIKSLDKSQKSLTCNSVSNARKRFDLVNVKEEDEDVIAEKEHDAVANIKNTPKRNSFSIYTEANLVSDISCRASWSCANIYGFSELKKLIFNCIFCNLRYADLDVFAKHLFDDHDLYQSDEEITCEHPFIRPRIFECPAGGHGANEDSLPTTHSTNLCGKIVILNSKSFYFHCTKCIDKFCQIDSLYTHLVVTHNLFSGTTLSTLKHEIVGRIGAFVGPAALVAPEVEPEIAVEAQPTQESEPEPVAPEVKDENVESPRENGEGDVETETEAGGEDNSNDDGGGNSKENANANVLAIVPIEPVPPEPMVASENIAAAPIAANAKPTNEMDQGVVPALPEAAAAAKGPIQPQATAIEKSKTSNAHPQPATTVETSGQQVVVKRQNRKRKVIELPEPMATRQRGLVSANSTPSSSLAAVDISKNGNAIKVNKRRAANSRRNSSKKSKYKEDNSDEWEDLNTTDEDSVKNVLDDAPSTSKVALAQLKERQQLVKEKKQKVPEEAGATKVAHQPRQDCFQCDKCEKSFKKSTRLKEHQRLHTGEKPFECIHCKKRFRIKNRLTDHLLRHNKEKAFRCEICGLGVATKQDLVLHQRHHSNDRRYKCSECPKAFVRSSDLKIHTRTHTGEKPFACDICGKAFRANQNLIVHRRSHTRDKTIQCEECGKEFIRKIDRKVHYRTHTGEKPYKCHICERAYSSRVHVRNHIERDHMKVGQSKKRGKPGPKPKNNVASKNKNAKSNKESAEKMLVDLIKMDDKELKKPESSASIATKAAVNAVAEVNDNNTISSTSASAAATNDENSSNIFITCVQKSEDSSSPPTPTSPNVTVSDVAVQQVSVTVSMQVENVVHMDESATATLTHEKENNSSSIVAAAIDSPLKENVNLTTQQMSVKKERKITTNYFTVVGQKTEI